MAQTSQRSGCGCCGCLGCLGSVVLVLVLAGFALVFLLYQTATADRPASPPALAANHQVYVSARKKWDDFNRDSSVRTLVLSDAQSNTRLAKPPKVGPVTAAA